LYMAWHSPSLFAEDDAELDLVAEVLASGKTSRLFRSLVYEDRMATEIAASQNSRELGGYFQIVATAAPGRTLAQLERAISHALDTLIEEGPEPREMERCQAQAEANFVYRLQTVGGFGGKSDQLNAYNIFLGDPGFFQRDLDRYRRVIPASMQRVAREWLDRSRRVLLSIVPKGRPELALAGSEPVAVS
jgi:zinc protease